MLWDMDPQKTISPGAAATNADADRRWLGRVCRFLALRAILWGALAVLVFVVLGGRMPVFFLRLLAPEPAAAPPARSVVSARSEPSSTADWPYLRGPAYNGSAPNESLADRWPAGGPPVLWVRDLGKGYSSFAAVGDRIYTQAQSLYAQSVLCLDADTGQTIWQQRCDWPYDGGGMYPGPRATPTWHAGRVYYATPQGRVGCLDAQSGQPIWSLDVVEKFSGRGHHFGYSCSPLVTGDLVILPVGGKQASIVALSADDGSTVWIAGDKSASYCSALPVTLEGGPAVVALLENTVALCDLPSGRLLWEHRWSDGYDEHAAFPIYQEPLLMIACPFRAGAEAYRLKRSGADGQVEAARIWTSLELSNDILSSVAVAGHVYGFDLHDLQAKVHRPSSGQFKCLELATGEVRWASDLPGHASAIFADGKLVLFNDRGEIVLVRENPDRYEELSRVKVFDGEICWTSPALARGRLYLRSPTRAACVYIGRAPLERRFAGAPPAAEISHGWRIDWNWLLRGEREAPFDMPDRRELHLWHTVTLLGVFLPAAIAGAAAFAVARRRPQATAQAVFWTSCFVLGIIATPLANRMSATFVFTWPACLFVAQQVALTALLVRPESGSRLAWLGRWAAVAGFFAVAFGYFHICRRLGMATQWVFLLGFVPSWPIALPAAALVARRPRLLRDAPLAVAGFALLFWSSVAYMSWRGGP